MPYADPLADGPVIQQAAQAARAANAGGFGLAETLALAAAFIADPGVDDRAAGRAHDVPQPDDAPRPAEGRARRRAAAGVAGFIVPDMPPESARAVARARASGLDTVFLAAPTSTAERDCEIVGDARRAASCTA